MIVNVREVSVWTVGAEACIVIKILPSAAVSTGNDTVCGKLRRVSVQIVALLGLNPRIRDVPSMLCHIARAVQGEDV
jgi:hypothetical protein